MTLWKLDPKATLFERLENNPPLWWRNLLADPQIWADVRKNNRINLYFRSGSIVDLSFGCDFNAKIHFEYVPLRESSTHIKYVFNGNSIDLDRSSLEIPPLGSFDDDVIKRLKKRIGKFNPSGSEKAIQSEFVLKNPGFIDTEFAHGKARIDLVWLDVPTKRIVFVELKTIGDDRLYFGGDTRSNNEGIAAQLQKYHDFISEHETELADYYRRLFAIKQKLDLLRGLDLQSIDDFSIEARPLLLVGDCTQLWIDRNGPEIDAHIRPCALGAFYHGRTTRDFRIPGKTAGNKHMFQVSP